MNKYAAEPKGSVFVWKGDGDVNEKDLLRRAEALGLRVSLYKLLPPNRRMAALRADVAREENRRKEEKDAQNQ